MDSSGNELILQLALHFLPGIGPVLTRNLISYTGSVEAVFKTKKHYLEKIPGIGKERAEIILSKKSFYQAENELRYIENNDIKALFYLNNNYPNRLKECHDAPVMLFYKGNADLNSRRVIGIVGTRHISTYGKQMTEQIIEELAAHDMLVVSGLAFGVDSAAHKAALNNGMPTVGVIAHGLEKMYPVDNRQLAQNMVKHGGLISEYAHNTKAEKDNFPARNRIVAGLCDAIVVIESAKRGGALITAAMANDYNRDVFAIPGRVNDLFSQGCNILIRQNKAALIETGSQIAETMNWVTVKNKGVQTELPLMISLNPEEEKIFNLLREKGRLTLDDLAYLSGQSVASTSTLLLTLEFQNLIQPLPGKVFEVKKR